MSAFAFDAQGRLWVTTSAATKHANDGVYLIAKPLARPVKVVSGLKGPLGLTWDGGNLYVASIGRVDEFSIVLTRSGSGYATQTFLTGLKNPLPLATARDGSLLVGDWGSGRIYRIAKRG